MNRLLSLLALAALVFVGSDLASAQRAVSLNVDPTVNFERLRPASAPAVGSWDSSYGALTIVQRADGRFIGNYSTYGRINGRMDGEGKMVGTFYHPENSGACSTTRQGSTNWGRFEFTFAPDYSSFKGKWNWCDGELNRTWNASKN